MLELSQKFIKVEKFNEMRAMKIEEIFSTFAFEYAPIRFPSSNYYVLRWKQPWRMKISGTQEVLLFEEEVLLIQ